MMYIDPNTGGMLFQILAVLFAAISGFILIFSGKIRMFFSKLRRRARETMESPGDSNENPDIQRPPDAQ
jgi:hypothetical protein